MVPDPDGTSVAVGRARGGLAACQAFLSVWSQASCPGVNGAGVGSGVSVAI